MRNESWFKKKPESNFVKFCRSNFCGDSLTQYLLYCQFFFKWLILWEVLYFLLGTALSDDFLHKPYHFSYLLPLLWSHHLLATQERPYSFERSSFVACLIFQVFLPLVVEKSLLMNGFPILIALWSWFQLQSPCYLPLQLSAIWECPFCPNCFPLRLL